LANAPAARDIRDPKSTKQPTLKPMTNIVNTKVPITPDTTESFRGG
jgi:hypothetical protein